MKLKLLIKAEIAKIDEIFRLMSVQTAIYPIVGILRFMCMINFWLSLVEHGKSSTILGPDLSVQELRIQYHYYVIALCFKRKRQYEH